MKPLRHGRPLGILLLVAFAATLIVPTADAGNRSKRARGDWRTAGRHQDRAWSDHPSHRWFDSREYCGGKDRDGCWRSEFRCEDRYGRKWVDDPGWVARHQRDDRDDWHRSDRRRSDDRDSYRTR